MSQFIWASKKLIVTYIAPSMIFTDNAKKRKWERRGEAIKGVTGVQAPE
jgi:hypothetical protein